MSFYSQTHIALTVTMCHSAIINTYDSNSLVVCSTVYLMSTSTAVHSMGWDESLGTVNEKDREGMAFTMESEENHEKIPSEYSCCLAKIQTWYLLNTNQVY